MIAETHASLPQPPAGATRQQSGSVGMSGASGGAARKAAHTSCRACRISKVCLALLAHRDSSNGAITTDRDTLVFISCRQVRCDLEANATGAMCSRCARLGLQCIPNKPSMRGKYDPASRLSPAVRALLSNAHGVEKSASAERNHRRSSHCESAAEGSGNSEEPQPNVLSLAMAHRASEQPVLCTSVGLSQEGSRRVSAAPCF